MQHNSQDSLQKVSLKNVTGLPSLEKPLYDFVHIASDEQLLALNTIITRLIADADILTKSKLLPLGAQRNSPAL